MRSFGLNDALMLIYAFRGAFCQTLLIHASTIRLGDYGYPFTAKSGTGKSTHSALWMKHIDSETSQRALDAIDDQTYVGILRPMLRQKRRSTKASSEYELTMKLIKFAMSRGFTMDIIRQCIDVDDESEFPE